MIKNPLLDKNSMDYIPSWDELKLPKRLRDKLELLIEDEHEASIVQKEFEHYESVWKMKHRDTIRKQEKSKAERSSRKYISHWFEALPINKKDQLIDESRKLCDEVLDLMLSKVTQSWQSTYIENLRLRVKFSKIDLTSASVDKLKRFPSYSESTDKLTGSAYAFYRMWAHCFRSERNGSKKLST